ncbi:Uma2 family endonuclease [Kitasatospora cineracea]|uniref:Uma2 family endonuclease n=1 Tax=Kitasatospora cineracea TaxID=88074 RepID=UPI0034214E25
MSTTEFEDPHLLADFLALETPEGYRAELVAGEIVLSPPQDGGHEAVIGRVLRQVFRADREFDYGGNKGLVVPGGRYVPDGTFTERGAMQGQLPLPAPFGFALDTADLFG